MLPSLDIAFYSFLSILHLFFLAPWMVSENLLAQMCGIQMHVYFRCAKVFVPKHLLYCTQVGTALNQMGGKTVTERMWRYLLRDSGIGGIVLDEDKKRYARQGLPPGPRHKDVVLITSLYVYMPAHLKPIMQFPDCPWRDGHQPLFFALSMYSYEPFVKEKVGDAQIYEFADAQAAAIQHLYDTMVPGSLGLAQVYGIKNLVYLIHRKHLWQMLPYLGRLHQFRGVLLYFLLQRQEAVKGTHSAQYSGYAARRYALVPQAPGKQVQFIQGDIAELYAVVRVEVEEFL